MDRFQTSTFFLFWVLLVQVPVPLQCVGGSICRSKPKASVIPLGERCSTNLQCETKLCDEGVCTCRVDTYYDPCTASCLPNCNTTISQSPRTGRISGPGYPQNTEPYYCSWTIDGGPNTYIVFSITDLDMGLCQNIEKEYIEIRDVINGKSLMDQACAQNDTTVRIVASYFQKLQITVKQSSIGYRTFTGIYYIYDYFATITDASGYIATPGFPKEYRPSSSYTWTLLGKQVNLKILAMSIDERNHVDYYDYGNDDNDLLSLYDGCNKYKELIGTFSSNTIPSNIYTTKDCMHLTFSSNSGNEMSGFSAYYYKEGYGATCDIDIEGMCKAPGMTCQYDQAGITRCLCESGITASNYTCNEIPECYTTIYQSPRTGRISGPGYPQRTEPYYCTWTIDGGQNTYIVFSLTDLDLGLCSTTEEDYIEIRDGFNGKKLMNRTCGRNDTTVRIVASYFQKLQITVKQKSIGSRTFTGIYYIYDYNSTITDASGYIASPGFPIEYLHLSSFSWKFLGKQVNLKFLELAMEPCGNCCNYLQLYNNVKDNQKLIATFCNSTISSNIYSAEDSLLLEFISDSGIQKSGFSAYYYTEGYGSTCDVASGVTCKGPGMTCQHDENGISKCLCKTGMFPYNYSCIEESAIEPIYKMKCNGVDLTLPKMIDIVASEIKLWSDSTQVHESSITNTTSDVIFLTGLKPGQEYTIQTSLHFAPDSVYKRKVYQYNWTIITLPASPGALVEESSNLIVKPYIIRFKPSEGEVTFYEIVFQSSDVKIVHSVKVPAVVTSELAPNTEYNYTITAFNQLGNQSETVNGSFKTGPDLNYGTICQELCEGNTLICKQDKSGIKRCLCQDGAYYVEEKSTCLKDVSMGYTVLYDGANTTLLSSNPHVTYNITWSAIQNDIDSGHMRIDKSSEDFSPTTLTPGQEYSFRIYSILPPDKFNNEQVVLSKITIVTLPADPGDLILDKSNLAYAPYILKFGHSKGFVEYYIITLNISNSNHEFKVKWPEIIYSNLSSDTTYQYTITAYNKLGNHSNTKMGNFKTISDLRYGTSCDYTTINKCKDFDLICRQDKMGETRCLCPHGTINYKETCLNGIKVNYNIKQNGVKVLLSPVIPSLYHNITWSATDDFQDRGKTCSYNSQKAVMMTGLTPGQEYVFKIYSYQPEDEFNKEQIFLTNFTLVTVPAASGDVGIKESNLKRSPYFIQFKPSEGKVDHYKVTLQSSSSDWNNTYTTEKSALKTSDLMANTLYNYAITAYNKLGNSSEAVQGSFKTG